MALKKRKHPGNRQMPVLFSYRRGNSVIHKIPALIKLILLCVVSIQTFSEAPAPFSPLARTICCGAVSACLFFLARTPVRHLKSLLFVPVMGLCITLFRATECIFPELPYIRCNVALFPAGILYTIRFFITATAALVLFETTSVLQIQTALEAVQHAAVRIVPPLARFFERCNPALTIALAISFIPKVFSAWNKLSTAALARSPHDTANKKLRPAIRIKNLSAQLSGMLSCLISSAEETRKAILNRQMAARQVQTEKQPEQQESASRITPV